MSDELGELRRALEEARAAAGMPLPDPVTASVTEWGIAWLEQQAAKAKAEAIEPLWFEASTTPCPNCAQRITTGAAMCGYCNYNLLKRLPGRVSAPGPVVAAEDRQTQPWENPVAAQMMGTGR